MTDLRERARRTFTVSDPDIPIHRALMRYRLAVVAAGEFDEDAHPRDEHGKFADKGGSEKESSHPVGSELRNLTPGSFEQMDEETGRALLEGEMHGGDLSPERMATAAKAQVAQDLADRLSTVPVKDLNSCLPSDNALKVPGLEELGNHDKAIVSYGNGVYKVVDAPEGIDRGLAHLELGGFDKIARMDTAEGERLAREAAVSGLVGNWAASSNDSNATSLFMQECAKQEFGLTGTTDWRAIEPATTADQYSTYGRVESMLADKDTAAAGRAFVQAQYEATQDYLGAAGIDRLALARGSMFNEDTAPAWVTGTDRYVDVPSRPMASWSTDIDTASNFASTDFNGGDIGVIQYASVPREAILACPRTGYGCFEESEFVVLHTGGASLIERT